jgi:hypothetical protein
MTANKSMTSRRFIDSTDPETSQSSKIDIFCRVKAREGITVLLSESEYFMVRLSSSAFPFELYQFQEEPYKSDPYLPGNIVKMWV